MSQLRSQYNQTYFRKFDTKEYAIKIITKELINLLQPTSVMDVGCGVGAWLRAFQDEGVQQVQGIDGAYVQPQWLKIPADHFRAFDLSQPITLTERYDLVLCLEVAEHLPAARAASFVQFLTQLAPIVVFSAAVPFQGGTRHLNERWPSYWAALFGQYGYVSSDVIRQKIWDDAAIPYFYRQNILLYVSPDTLAQYPMLQAGSCSALNLVHPALLEEIHLWRALRLVACALRNALQKRLVS